MCIYLNCTTKLYIKSVCTNTIISLSQREIVASAWDSAAYFALCRLLLSLGHNRFDLVQCVQLLALRLRHTEHDEHQAQACDAQEYRHAVRQSDQILQVRETLQHDERVHTDSRRADGGADVANLIGCDDEHISIQRANEPHLLHYIPSAAAPPQ